LFERARNRGLHREWEPAGRKTIIPQIPEVRHRKNRTPEVWRVHDLLPRGPAVGVTPRLPPNRAGDQAKGKGGGADKREEGSHAVKSFRGSRKNKGTHGIFTTKPHFPPNWVDGEGKGKEKLGKKRRRQCNEDFKQGVGHKEKKNLPDYRGRRVRRTTPLRRRPGTFDRAQNMRKKKGDLRS